MWLALTIKTMLLKIKEVDKGGKTHIFKTTPSLASGYVWGQSSTKFHRKITLLSAYLQTELRNEYPQAF